MKRAAGIICIVMILFAAGIGYWLYPRFFSPIYTWEVNIPAGPSSATSRLISDDGRIYQEEKPADPGEYRFGRQIGRTADGMRIHEVKGDPSHNRVMLTGFMFPALIFSEE